MPYSLISEKPFPHANLWSTMASLAALLYLIKDLGFYYFSVLSLEPHIAVGKAFRIIILMKCKIYYTYFLHLPHMSPHSLLLSNTVYS